MRAGIDAEGEDGNRPDDGKRHAFPQRGADVAGAGIATVAVMGAQAADRHGDRHDADQRGPADQIR